MVICWLRFGEYIFQFENKKQDDAILIGTFLSSVIFFKVVLKVWTILSVKPFEDG